VTAAPVIALPDPTGYQLLCPPGSFVTSFKLNVSAEALQQIGPIACTDFETGIESEVPGTAGGSLECCAESNLKMVSSAAGFVDITIKSTAAVINAVKFTDADELYHPTEGFFGNAEAGKERDPYGCPPGWLISGFLGNTAADACDDSLSKGCDFVQTIYAVCTPTPAERSG
jgi:hypothetical protein